MNDGLQSYLFGFTQTRHASPYELPCLTLRGPCIVIYSYNKRQQDALFLYFILLNNSTCFGQTFNITSLTNTNCREYSIKTPDDGE